MLDMGGKRGPVQRCIVKHFAARQSPSRRKVTALYYHVPPETHGENEWVLP